MESQAGDEGVMTLVSYLEEGLLLHIFSVLLTGAEASVRVPS